jgi:TPP-dependent pyruvate/acetoin dehydrogenase alpha subunit
LIVIIQDNKVALGTRLDQHHRGSFLDWPEAYGVEGVGFDGNHVLDAYAATHIAAKQCREGRGPALLIADTFRMGGHATHDEREARATFDPTLFLHWGKRDPIGVYETYLIQGPLDLDTGRQVDSSEESCKRNTAILQRIEQKVTDEVERAIDEALMSARNNMPIGATAADGVYAETEEVLTETVTT